MRAHKNTAAKAVALVAVLLLLPATVARDISDPKPSVNPPQIVREPEVVSVPADPPNAALRPSEAPTGAISAAISGVASWYCGNGSPCTRGYGPSDLTGAIDPTLGIRRGATVTVQANGRSVAVRIIDVCACPGARLIDLSSGAFKRLAPLSAGLVRITLIYNERHQPRLTLPPTDTE